MAMSLSVAQKDLQTTVAILLLKNYNDFSKKKLCWVELDLIGYKFLSACLIMSSNE
jgi:hypothetical protein